MMIDAAGLRVIRAVADHGSFTAAAASLGYTQPAISQMVRRLEQRTGTVLVERLGRTVRLTEAGTILARYATTVLSSLEAAEAELTAIAGLRSGRVRLMAFPSVAAMLVPGALRLMQDRFPDVTVTFTEGEPVCSLAALRAGRCDLTVVFSYDDPDVAEGAEDLEGLDARMLMEEDVCVVLPETHALAGSDSVDIAALAGERWIAGCPRCRGHLMSVAEHGGFTPNVAFETEDYVAVLAFVSAGLGIALVPELVVRATHTPGVVSIPLSQPSRRTIRVVTTPDLARVPAVAETMACLQEGARAAEVVQERPSS